MSTAAERARAKADRLAARQQEQRQAPTAEAEVSLDAPAAGDTTPVRLTLDMAPPLYGSFEAWARTVQRQHRLGRAVKADVLRILTRRLMADEELQQEVVKALIAERRK